MAKTYSKWTVETIQHNIVGTRKAIVGTKKSMESLENEYQRESHKSYLSTLERNLKEYEQELMGRV